MKSKKQAPAPPKIISNESLSNSLNQISSPSLSMTETTSSSNYSPPQRSNTETTITPIQTSMLNNLTGSLSNSTNKVNASNSPANELGNSNSLLSRITSKFF